MILIEIGGRLMWTLLILGTFGILVYGAIRSPRGGRR